MGHATNSTNTTTLPSKHATNSTNTTTLPSKHSTNSTPISHTGGPKALASDQETQSDSSNAATDMSEYQICNAPEDCVLRVRSRLPENGTASVELCSCYPSSLLVSFDECEGETDETCAVAECPDACEGYDVTCSGMGRCMLESLDESSSVAPRSGIFLNILILFFAGISFA